MVKKKVVLEENIEGQVFKSDKHALLTVAVIVLVALIAFNLENITGKAITEPSSLSVSQSGKKITVQVNYPKGEYGKPNNFVDMRAKPGTKTEDAETMCDNDRGYANKGTSRCAREIAVFDITGTNWERGQMVTFSVRGTNIKKDYKIP